MYNENSTLNKNACQVFDIQLCLLKMESKMKKRKYTKTKRAEQQAQMRENIVEATVACHEELGPAKTSIKAIADRAGVQRVTVYRYFPDDHSLFQACTSHWLSLNPPPDVAGLKKKESADEQTFAVLLALYKYYRHTESMWTGAYRDIEEVAALKNAMKGFESYIEDVRNSLLGQWKFKGIRKKRLSITLRHCLRFNTWQSLKNEKLNDKQITELVLNWIKSEM